MSLRDLQALMPLMILAGAAVVVMLAVTIRRNHQFTLFVTLMGLGLAATWPHGEESSRIVQTLMVFDGFAVFYIRLVAGASFVVAMLAYDYWSAREAKKEEFYILLLLATLGAAGLAASVHFASFFLSLELLTASLYALVAYDRGGAGSIEAGVKYLVLGGASSALMLFGIAMVYAASGELSLSPLTIAPDGGGEGVLAGCGLALVLAGVGFKLAVAPFHLWAADVYQGAPAPVAAFVGTVSKGAVLALLVRMAAAMEVRNAPAFQAALSVTAIASMFAGNWLALRQRNVKRMLAYSSIAHMGYLLVAFLAGGEMALTAVAFYLCAYFATTLAAFGVVSVLSGSGREAEELDDYVGLARRRPMVAAVFVAAILSLAGMPLTAGFIGKFYLLAAGVGSGLWLLVGALAVNSVIALFYYLRFVAAVFRRAGEGSWGMLSEAKPSHVAVSAARSTYFGSVALAATVVTLVYLGVYPSPAIKAIQAFMAGLTP